MKELFKKALPIYITMIVFVIITNVVPPLPGPIAIGLTLATYLLLPLVIVYGITLTSRSISHR